MKNRQFLKGLISNLIMSFVMSAVLSLVMTLVNVGFDAPIFWRAYFNSLGITFLVSFVIGLVANPLITKAVNKLVKDKDIDIK